MAQNDAKIVLSGEDKTKAAFDSAKRNLAQIQGTAEGLNSSFSRLGTVLGSAFAVGTFSAFIKGTAEGLAKLEDLKTTTGSSVQNLSALEDVGKRTGNTFETVADTLVKFNKVLIEATPGSDKANILKSIGLDAEALKRIDPAEALRQTAVALEQFSNDGNKARITQALFNKGLQEIAPFLKDLASQTELVGTVSREQAEEAKKFGDQLAVMKKNSEDLARAFTSSLLPAMNTFLERLLAIKQGGGFWSSVFNEAEANLLSERLNGVVKDIEKFQKYVNENPNSNAKFRLAELRQEYAQLQSQLGKTSDALKKFAGIAKPTDSGSFESGFSGSDNLKRKAPGIPGASTKGGKDSGLSAEQIARLQVQAEEDAAKEASEAWSYFDKQRLAEAEVRAQAEKTQWKQVFEFIDDEQDRAIEEGQAFLKKAVDKGDEFTKEAARNIQDALGDTVFDALSGKFDDLGKRWGDLLKRMASQAIAAQIGKALFGDYGKTGELGGAAGSIWSAIVGGFTGGSGASSTASIPSYDVGTPFVPRDGLAMVHRGERITPAAQNRGGGSTIYQTNYIDSRTDAASVAQIAASAAQQAVRQYHAARVAQGAAV